jgi:hypothetical protein
MSIGQGLAPPALPRLVAADLTEPTEVGDRICGGVMEVFIERITPKGEPTSQSVPP